MPALNFLNPSALLGLVAISIPVLIHILSRRRVQDVEFSSIVFLRKLSSDRMHRLNLKKLLLLMIRSLIIACVVLSFSRPALMKGSVGTPTGGRTLALILLDRSFSMSYKIGNFSAFELARSATLKLLHSLEGDSRVIVIPFDDEPEYLGEELQEPEALKEKLTDLSVSSRGTNIPAALNFSLNLLRGFGAGYNREIYVITDMAASGWDGEIDPELMTILENSRIYVVSVTDEERENVAVESVYIPEGVLLGKTFRVNAKVSNYGKSPAENVMAYLYLNGRKVSQQMLRISPYGKSSVVFEVPSLVRGSIYGQVELSEDRLPADNRRYFSFDLPERVEILLVSEDRGDSYFVHKALNSASLEGGTMIISEREPGALSSGAISSSDAIFILNVSRLPDVVLSSLLDEVGLGKGLFVSLGPRSDISFYNGKVVPMISEGSIGPSSERVTDESYYPLGDIDILHPILEGIAPKGHSISWPRFYGFYRSELPEAAPIMKYSNGMLALGEFRLGRGKVFLLTAPLDLSWSDLPLLGIFAPLILRTALYLAVDVGQAEGYVVGRKVSGWLTDGVEGRLWCKDPLGREHNISPLGSSEGYIWEMSDPGKEGIWGVFSGDSEIDMFVVNLDPHESDTRAVSENSVEGLLGKSRVTFIQAHDDIAETLRGYRGGRELWKWFLTLAVALVFAEMYLARPGRPQ